jgi:dimeric dUTPase (all-alpha-NTP-PPase superfamily)
MYNKLMNLRQNMENSITKYCQISDSILHHPKLLASSNDFNTPPSILM